MPTIVVLSATSPQRFLDAGVEITDLSDRVRVGVGGAGATLALAHRIGVELLAGDATGKGR